MFSVLQVLGSIWAPRDVYRVHRLTTDLSFDPHPQWNLYCVRKNIIVEKYIYICDFKR